MENFIFCAVVAAIDKSMFQIHNPLSTIRILYEICMATKSLLSACIITDASIFTKTFMIPLKPVILILLGEIKRKRNLGTLNSFS